MSAGPPKRQAESPDSGKETPSRSGEFLLDPPRARLLHATRRFQTSRCTHECCRERPHRHAGRCRWRARARLGPIERGLKSYVGERTEDPAGQTGWQHAAIETKAAPPFPGSSAANAIGSASPPSAPPARAPGATWRRRSRHEPSTTSKICIDFAFSCERSSNYIRRFHASPEEPPRRKQKYRLNSSGDSAGFQRRLFLSCTQRVFVNHNEF